MRPLLLVEDGIPSCDTLRWTLRSAGHNVICVIGAEEALDSLHEAGKPSLVVLHCRRSDPELLSGLKQVGAPVVVISAAKWASGEADAFLPAPVNDADLLKVVRSHRPPDT
jgi:DNA-binding NtrC family response regulator